MQKTFSSCQPARPGYFQGRQKGGSARRLRSLAQTIIGPLRFLGVPVITASLIGLTGCSIVHDRSNEYMQAQSEGPLRTPAWYDRKDIKPLHPIPVTEREKLASKTFTVPKPPDLTNEILEKNYVIEQMDGQLWLLVNEVPGRVWPAVAGFFADHGIEPAIQNAQAGLMQTQAVQTSLKARKWLDGVIKAAGNRQNLNGPVVLQAKISPGVRRHTSEIQIRFRTPAQAPDGMLGWESRPENPALDRQLLSNLGDFMKSRENTKSYSRLALQMETTPKVRMITPQSGKPHLVMDLKFARAWTEVDRALKNAKIPIVDINRSAGTWYVDFRTKEERSGGWFSWLWGHRKPEYTYQVHLRHQGKALALFAGRAPDYDGKDRSARLLSMIYQHLY